MKLSSNTTLIILVTILVAAGAYWYFFTGTGNEIPITLGGEENQVQTQFQMLAGRLQPIIFDTKIFTKPAFNALVDLTTPIMPESSGRLDPFAPVTSITAR